MASRLFAGHLAAAADGERDGLLSGHASLPTALFDPASPPGDDPSALVRGLYWLTVNLASGSGSGSGRGAGDGPGSWPGAGPAGLLIEVDDAQWADRPSLRYLAYLAARIDELPAALVMAVRSGEEAADEGTLAWLRDRPGGQVLKPRR